MTRRLAIATVKKPTKKKEFPDWPDKPPKPQTERQLLEKLVEQGTKQIALLGEIKEKLKMPVTNEQITEALGRIEGNTENIQTYVQTTNTEIAALRAEIERLTQEGGLTAAQEETLLAHLNTIDEAQDAALGTPTPPSE